MRFRSLSYLTVLAKTDLLAPKLNSILLPQFTNTLKIYPSPVYQVLNVNWSTFLKGILPTPKVMAGTMPPMEGTTWAVGTWICSYWLCGPLVCHWPLYGSHGCSWSVPSGGFCHLPPHPTHPSPSHPTLLRRPSHPPPLLSIMMAERDGKKYHEIQLSEIEEVSYNKNQ